MARRPIRHAGGGDDEDVNVTPLLDIVFIMLIFFIVTSTFIKEPGIDTDRPTAEISDKVKLIALLVGISADDEVWIDNEVYSIDEVKAKVQELRRETPKGRAVLRVDADASSETMLDVIEQMKQAGEEQIQIATEE